MTTRLKNLVVKEVSLVDDPANPEARVVLFKRNEPPKGGEDTDKGVIGRILAAIGKRLGWAEPEVEKMMGEAMMYDDKMAEKDYYKVEGEMYDKMYALHEAMCSVLKDPSVDKMAMMRGSLDQFAADMEMCMPRWAMGETVEKAGRKISAARMTRLKAMRDELDKMIHEAEGDMMKGDDPMSETNKGALPDEVTKRLADLEASVAKMADLEKRAADLEKRATDAEARADAAEKAVKAQADAQRKAELLAKAAKYPGQGKVEDVADMLEKAYSLSEDFGKQLEANFAATEAKIANSGIFNEFGKTGAGGDAGSTWAKIEAIAAGMVAKDAKMTQAQAVDAVLRTDEGQRLYAEYKAEKAGGK